MSEEEVLKELNKEKWEIQCCIRYTGGELMIKQLRRLLNEGLNNGKAYLANT